MHKNWKFIQNRKASLILNFWPENVAIYVFSRVIFFFLNLTGVNYLTNSESGFGFNRPFLSCKIWFLLLLAQSQEVALLKALFLLSPATTGSARPTWWHYKANLVWKCKSTRKRFLLDKIIGVGIYGGTIVSLVI